ncbi:hypothetical protein [Alkaliphilus sp. B6464]|uniref:hypothetical protein n=1 Tax=Alkaliphilus sp. B6464 TaxID=2731219 RepID=UPI001BADC876|nr:hypothetical protein [Alkaliphilus sp. B6464]QUH21223.1 hypothetical protein HYG84_15920 [Alkaliphilus sp. B6464]
MEKKCIKKKVEEQKIIELGITASDEEAREGYEEIVSIKQAYLDKLIKEAEIGVQEEYLDFIPEIFEVNKLNVKN